MTARATHPRIAHLLPWPEVGGTEVATLRMATALDGGFEHVMLCRAEAEPVRALFDAKGFETARYRCAELSYRRPAAFLRASLELARELRARRVDLLHGSDLAAAHVGGLAGRLARVPVLCHVRNPHDVIPRRDRPLLATVARFAFVSRHVQDRFAYRAPGVLVYDGVDVPPGDRPSSSGDVRAELGVAPDARLVGMVARLAEQKDHATYLRAAARIVRKEPRARFLVVGDHRAHPIARQRHVELAALTRELGIAHAVVFTGFRADVPRLLDAMDVVVLATHFEGFGLAVLEAMAAGRPVVATAVGGLLEIIDDGATGLLHRPRDDRHLAEQVESLLLDERRAARMGVAARDAVRARFARARCAERLGEVYREMLGQGGC